MTRRSRCKPYNPEGFNNRGTVLQDFKRFSEALASYDKAIALKPDYAEAFYNRGIVLQGLCRFGEALACYDAAIALKRTTPKLSTTEVLCLRSLSVSTKHWRASIRRSPSTRLRRSA